MMSKKRFENRNKRFKPIKNYGKGVNEVFIKDTINDWYIYTEDDVVDLLNSLAEENEQLKIANAKWLDKSLQDKWIRYSNENHKELTKKYLQLKNENEQLKERLYNFEKRKIIEESDMNEDVIPKVKMLRIELFGEKYG